jgi:thymidylate kinase
LNKFFALVGPAGAGKSTLLAQLRTALPSDQYIFLCDSTGCGDEFAPHVQFATKVTELARARHHEYTSPRSQLQLFWSRLTCIIECDVAPALQSGKTVIMDGFGGTVLAHALHAARSEKERGQLLDLHKDLIRHNVLANGVPPPKYLWLKPSPAEALKRLTKDGKSPRVTQPLQFIAEINRWFDFYGTLPGQTVIPVDADQPHPVVFDVAMSYIRPLQALHSLAA